MTIAAGGEIARPRGLVADHRALAGIRLIAPHPDLAPVQHSGSTLLSATLAEVATAAWTTWSGCRRRHVLSCRNTTGCPSWSDASGDRALSAFLVEQGALMIVASVLAQAGIVPVAIFSPFSAKCRCTSSNSRRPRSCALSRWRKRHTVVASGTGSRPRSIPTKPRIATEAYRASSTAGSDRLNQHPLDPNRRTAIAGLGIERLDQPAQRRPRHHPRHLREKHRPPGRLGVALKLHTR